MGQTLHYVYTQNTPTIIYKTNYILSEIDGTKYLFFNILMHFSHLKNINFQNIILISVRMYIYVYNIHILRNEYVR